MTGGHPLGAENCMAGRILFFDGRWNHIPPCTGWGRHNIVSDGLPAVINGHYVEAIRLCNKHFTQVNEANLISDAYVGYQYLGDDRWRPGVPPEEFQ